MRDLVLSSAAGPGNGGELSRAWTEGHAKVQVARLRSGTDLPARISVRSRDPRPGEQPEADWAVVQRGCCSVLEFPSRAGFGCLSATSSGHAGKMC